MKAKWIIGGLGWMAGGPIGAAIGYAIGAIIDAGSNKPVRQNSTGQRKNYRRDEFLTDDISTILIVLTAALMRADGNPKKSELDFVKNYFKKQFGIDATRKHLLVLREMLKQHVSVRQVCLQVAQHVNHPQRLQLMHYLFGVANADGHFHREERRLLHTISGYFRINARDFNTISALYDQKEIYDPYKILGIQKSSSEAEIKKAYRALARRYHPDKVATQGETHRKAAEEKFKQLQKAYEEVKRRKGIV